MLHFDLSKTPQVSISAMFLKLFCAPWNPPFSSLTNPADWANMLNFHTFAEYSYFQCQSTILYNFDLPRDPSESQHINISKVFKAFWRTLKSSILIPYEPPRLSVDFCFKTPTRVTFLLAKHQNHHKTSGKQCKINRWRIVHKSTSKPPKPICRKPQ